MQDPADHPGRRRFAAGAADGNAMGGYVERYVYDAVGNFLEMKHRGSDPAHPGWTRTYAYKEPGQLDSTVMSNRLTSTTIGSTTETHNKGGDGYDDHGNMLHMPHLQVMQWDFRDQLQLTQRQNIHDDDADGVAHQGERTWYVYDANGQRVRKVTELSNNGGLKDERIYLGNFEMYHHHSGTDAGLVRETLHIMDDKQRVGIVETRNDVDDGTAKQLIRYQFGNHLGSRSLELDEGARIVSYEEYMPYGATAYQAVDKDLKSAAKRYRYTGKERDEESDLYYHGARSYACWLGRWISPDPANLLDGPNSYAYVTNNPIRKFDIDGRVGVEDIYNLGRGFHSEARKTVVSGVESTLLDPFRKPLNALSEIHKAYQWGGVSEAVGEYGRQAMKNSVLQPAIAFTNDVGKKGLANAINDRSPVARGIEAGFTAYEAADRGDLYSAGKAVFQSETAIVETVGLASATVKAGTSLRAGYRKVAAATLETEKNQGWSDLLTELAADDLREHYGNRPSTLNDKKVAVGVNLETGTIQGATSGSKLKEIDYVTGDEISAKSPYPKNEITYRYGNVVCAEAQCASKHGGEAIKNLEISTYDIKTGRPEGRCERCQKLDFDSVPTDQ